MKPNHALPCSERNGLWASIFSSYLWSPELHGLATWPSFLWWRKIRSTIITVVCAASIDPRSAIVIITRAECWPAGATNVWINSTNDQAFLPSSPCQWYIPRPYQVPDSTRRIDMPLEWMARYCRACSLST